jgi:predicted glycosyl hydrolase (DUF1957 family)
VETHGLLHAEPPPRYGVYGTVSTPSGVTAFGRDPESSKAVWSSIEGYPGDFDYREFYRDIGSHPDYDTIKPYLPAGGIRTLFSRFLRLALHIQGGGIRKEGLAHMESGDGFFPGIDPRVFAPLP